MFKPSNKKHKNNFKAFTRFKMFLLFADRGLLRINGVFSLMCKSAMNLRLVVSSCYDFKVNGAASTQEIYKYVPNSIQLKNTY